MKTNKENAIMSKECVTHHFACDCRERKFAELERENAALRERISTIPDPIWSKADLVQQIHQAYAERDELQRQNAALRTELAALRTAYERMAEKAAARKEAQP